MKFSNFMNLCLLSLLDGVVTGINLFSQNQGVAICQVLQLGSLCYSGIVLPGEAAKRMHSLDNGRPSSGRLKQVLVALC